jgi:Ca2+-transporting ATPase
VNVPRPFFIPEGLGEAEAVELLRRFGRNVVSEPRRRTLVEIIQGTLREPMFLLLLVAAALYLVFGDIGEGLFLLAGATLSLGLVIGQEVRSERALAELNALAEPTAHVVRGGIERRIAASEIVPGDLLVLAEGSRIPADAHLVAGDVLTVDESALTGEAAAVSKSPAGQPSSDDPLPGEPVSPSLFAGTMIVRGSGQAVVTRTGKTTRFGRIGAALATATEEPTLLQRSVARLIGRLGFVAVCLCLVVALAYGAVRGDWLAGALAGLTLAISLLPEEFPMVLAVFMALGAWRLARHNVIVRRSAVIETLGATSLLCVDKTGTLTENRMGVCCVWRSGATLEVAVGGVSEAARATLTVGQLASGLRSSDPMDAAVHEIIGAPPAGQPLRSYPLRPDFLAFTQVWPDTEDRVVYAVKGAPETVLALCDVSDGEAAEIEGAVARLAGEGLRVLGTACAQVGAGQAPDPSQLRYRFEGLIGFADPVRADVPAALDEARRAGVSVAMITGDYPATALAIARSAGIDTSAGVVTGAQLRQGALSNAQLAATRVFARIMPEQKLELVAALRAAGHVVAMTGDGINDAPALAAAHIGIAMGRRGTDVARDASDLILVDDRFASIVGGIRLGRRIFANLRRAMTFITAIHVPIAGLALLPILLGLPPLLFPMHVVLLELLIDPLCSLAFEGERSDEDAMRKPPRPAAEPLFGPRQMLLALLQGTILLGATLGLYWSLLGNDVSEDSARASTFIALVVGNLSLALAEASGRHALFSREQTVFWGIGAAALVVVTLCLLVPPLADVLRFALPSPTLLLLGIVAGIGAGGWYRIAVIAAGGGRSGAVISEPEGAPARP